MKHRRSADPLCTHCARFGCDFADRSHMQHTPRFRQSCRVLTTFVPVPMVADGSGVPCPRAAPAA
jgi:hypothetical protein